MDEAEWLASIDTPAMLLTCRSIASERKLRLFAVGVCHLYGFMLVPESMSALEVAERYADGLATSGERKEARDKALHAGWCKDESTRHRRGPAKASVAHALARRAFDAAMNVAEFARPIGVLSKGARARRGFGSTRSLAQANWTEPAVILRDIFGNPFRPVTFEPSLRTSNVVGLAQAIYDDRAFDRLPILADALLDAGCEDEAIISHCRSPGPHVRGCWVLDLLLCRS